MMGYAIFALLCLIYLGCWVCWVCVLVYSLVFNKGKTRWLKPLLITLGLIGLSPLLLYTVNYTIGYAINHPSVSSVSGSYQGSFDGEKDTITLRPDGTFSQQFVTPSGKAFTRMGRWSLRAIGFNLFDVDDYDTVVFDKVIVRISGTGNGQKPQFDMLDAPEEVDSSSICFRVGDPDSEGNRFTR